MTMPLVPVEGVESNDAPIWTEITRFPEDAEDGRHTWMATVVRGGPWDPGDHIDHTLYVGWDADEPDDYLWQTVYSDRAGPNVDASGYTGTLESAQAAAEADVARQPNLGEDYVCGPTIIRCPSATLPGGAR